MVLGTLMDVSAIDGPRAHLELERLAAQALTAQDFVAAFKFADRRCRVGPPPAAHCFVLRAEANWRLGRQEAALADLDEAFLIDPSDLRVNRRMLAWASGDRRRAAAANLVGHDGNAAILRTAIAELRRAGEQRWAACSVFDNHVTGWIAWTDASALEANLVTNDGTLTILIEPDSFHPLASMEIQATAFVLRRPPSRTPQTLTLTCDGEIFWSRRLAPNLSSPVARHSTARLPPDRCDTTAPTVVVPVYRDTQATIDCLESLISAKASDATKTSFRILAVDDASPEAELRQHLRELAGVGAIDLLVNPANLGFVGAVNRALDELTTGDVVLLNADTIVPPGFVDRLAMVARSAPDIGLVTPLSNNGDIFSFPVPNDVNPMPSYDQICEIDRVASAANPRTAIDAPSGIGFCLYITRDCLDAVGGLSETFERGYLEDVDLSLRARARGFRVVCAPSVYVGHHGSKSFQHEKRSLVLRNLSVLDQRFPNYRNECRAFEAADPLRPARAALERALPWPSEPTVLIVGHRRASSAEAEERARHLGRDGERAILLLREGDVVHLKAADAGTPQAMQLHFDTEAAIGDGAEILARLRPRRVEVVDSNPSPRLIDLIRRLGVPISFWLIGRGFDEAALSLLAGAPVLVPGKAAKAFAEARWPELKTIVQDWPRLPLTLPPPSGPCESLAVIPSAPSPASLRVIRRLAETLQRRQPSRPIIVVGATCDDRRLMSYPNVFITGNVTAHELGGVLAPHHPGWLLTDFEAPAFGHPLVEAAKQASRPVAYRDWSGGSMNPRRRDLAISRDVTEARLVDAVIDWVEHS